MAFNHDWLKNRFILTLHRAQQVELRRLKDTTIREDVDALITEWPERMATVMAIFEEDGPAVDALAGQVRRLFPQLRPEAVAWLSEVTATRGRPNEKVQRFRAAREAVSTLDREIREFAYRSGSRAPDRIAKLLRSARDAADLLSSLRTQSSRC